MSAKTVHVRARRVREKRSKRRRKYSASKAISPAATIGASVMTNSVMRSSCEPPRERVDPRSRLSTQRSKLRDVRAHERDDGLGVRGIDVGRVGDPKRLDPA